MRVAWRRSPLFLGNLIALCLMVSLFWPLTGRYWQTLDMAFFRWCNGLLVGRPMLQLFWALANHKLADWVVDLIVLLFFVAHVKRGAPEKKQRIAEVLFCIGYIACIVYFINLLLFRENLSIPRVSPTYTVKECVRLSQQVPWLLVKDSSPKSFPGDHGTTALLFAAFYATFAKRTLGLLACFYAIFLCLPRLITGAHWLSDILVGSGSIALFFYSWAFFTPLAGKTISLIMRWVPKFASR